MRPNDFELHEARADCRSHSRQEGNADDSATLPGGVVLNWPRDRLDPVHAEAEHHELAKAQSEAGGLKGKKNLQGWSQHFV